MIKLLKNEYDRITAEHAASWQKPVKRTQKVCVTDVFGKERIIFADSWLTKCLETTFYYNKEVAAIIPYVASVRRVGA